MALRARARGGWGVSALSALQDSLARASASLEHRFGAVGQVFFQAADPGNRLHSVIQQRWHLSRVPSDIHVLLAPAIFGLFVKLQAIGDAHRLALRNVGVS